MATNRPDEQVDPNEASEAYRRCGFEAGMVYSFKLNPPIKLKDVKKRLGTFKALELPYLHTTLCILVDGLVAVWSDDCDESSYDTLEFIGWRIEGVVVNTPPGMSNRVRVLVEYEEPGFRSLSAEPGRAFDRAWIQRVPVNPDPDGIIACMDADPYYDNPDLPLPGDEPE